MLGGTLYDVFMFRLRLFFYVCFHSKLLLSHLLGTLVVSMLKLVHTTMLEKPSLNKINSITLFVGM
jgi:hypothetical protein